MTSDHRLPVAFVLSVSIIFYHGLLACFFFFSLSLSLFSLYENTHFAFNVLFGSPMSPDPEDRE